MTSAASPEKMEAVKWAQEDGYVLVRHMCRSPLTRTKRAARSGHRRQGVVLGNGQRIRKMSLRQLTKIGLDVLIADKDRVLEFVRVGTLELCEPRTAAPIPYEMLPTLLGSLAPVAPPPASKPPPPPPPPPPGPQSPTDGYTEEELEKKTRSELNKIAEKFGVASPHKLPSKPAVIEAIFAAATGGEE